MKTTKFKTPWLFQATFQVEGDKTIITVNESITPMIGNAFPNIIIGIHEVEDGNNEVIDPEKE